MWGPRGLPAERVRGRKRRTHGVALSRSRSFIITPQHAILGPPLLDVLFSPSGRAVTQRRPGDALLTPLDERDRAPADQVSGISRTATLGHGPGGRPRPPRSPGPFRVHSN